MFEFLKRLFGFDKKPNDNYITENKSEIENQTMRSIDRVEEKIVEVDPFTAQQESILSDESYPSIIKYPYTDNREFIIKDNVVKNYAEPYEYSLRKEIIKVPIGITAIGKSAFADKHVKKIIIPETVIKVENSAFCNCEIESIIVPKSVTKISASAFSGCKYLKFAALPNSITKISDAMFSKCEKLEEIIMPEYATVIGGWAFDNCTSLKKIVIPNGVKIIGDNAFGSCKSLTEIKIPEGVETIEQNAFWGCENIKSIFIPKSVTSISSLSFIRCAGLERITVENGNPKYHSFGNCLIETESKKLILGCNNSILPNDGSVKVIGFGAFENRKDLKVTLPDSLEEIGNDAFKGCDGLTDLIIPENVSKIDSGAFQDCIHLTRLTFKGSPKEVGIYAFNHCIDLKEVHIKDTESWCNIKFSIGANPLIYAHNLFVNGSLITSLEIPEAVKEINEYTFFGAHCLQKVILSDSITKIGGLAFGDCKNLANIEIGNSSQLTTLGYVSKETSYNSDTYQCYGAFHGCSSLQEATIPKNVVNIAFCTFSDCNNLKTIYWNAGAAQKIKPENSFHRTNTGKDFPNSITNLIIGKNVKAIPISAFHLDNLKSLIISKGVEVIEKEAFSNCKSLEKIVIPKSVKIIGESAFQNCVKLNNVIIPNGVETIGKMAFYGCKSLSQVKLSDSILSIGESAFDKTAFYDNTENWQNGFLYLDNHLIYAKSNSQDINELYIREGTVTIADKAISSNFSNVIKISLPNGLSAIGDSAFKSFENLKTIEIPNSVKSIGTWAFWCCKRLINLKLPDSLMFIGEFAFSYCDSIENLSIPDNVLKIESFAFSDCKNLACVNIGNGITELPSYVFSKCSNLKKVILGNSIDIISETAFSDCNKIESIVIVEGNLKYHSNQNCLICNETKTLLWGCGNSIIPIDGSVSIIGKHAFADCHDLTQVLIPDSVIRICEGAFVNCDGLENVTIGNGIKLIESWAFKNCKDIKQVNFNGDVDAWASIEFADGTSNPLSYSNNLHVKGKLVTKLAFSNTIKEIKSCAFQSCKSLQSVIIPSNIIKIGKYAFSGCNALCSANFHNIYGWRYENYCNNNNRISDNNLCDTRISANLLTVKLSSYDWKCTKRHNNKGY